jgi:hypothetical protein
VRIILVVIALVMAACGGKDSDDKTDPIGESYHEALDKAENVESIVEQQAEAARKELEEAEGN